eukprot:gene5032-5528_t
MSNQPPPPPPPPPDDQLPPTIDRTLIDSFADGYQHEAMIIAPDGSVNTGMIPIDNSGGGAGGYGSTHPPPPVSFFFPRFPIMHPYANSGGGGGGSDGGVAISAMEPWEWKGYVQPEAALPLPLGLPLGPHLQFPANPTAVLPSHLSHHHHHLSPLVAAAAAVGITPAMAFPTSNVTLASGDMKDIPPLPAAPSTAAKERRRERNKLLARKTRMKKKAELETLRDTMIALMVENEKLRQIVQTNISTSAVIGALPANQLIHGDLDLPDNILAMIQQMIHNHGKAHQNELSQKQQSYCIANPHAHDCPIVYASPGFQKLTGYSREEVVGRNCRFLQGPETDKVEVEVMRQALQEEKDITVVLLNYQKNGTPFWNKIELAHLRDGDGKVSFIVALQNSCGPHCLHARLVRRKAMLACMEKRSAGALPQVDEDGEDEEDEEHIKYSTNCETDTQGSTDGGSERVNTVTTVSSPSPSSSSVPIIDCVDEEESLSKVPRGNPALTPEGNETMTDPSESGDSKC